MLMRRKQTGGGVKREHQAAHRSLMRYIPLPHVWISICRTAMLRQSCCRSSSVLCLSHQPWLLVFVLCAAAMLSTELKYTQGLQVTSTGPQTIQKAEGESVTLGCRFTSSPLDTGVLDIEWSVVSPDTTQKDQMLMSYTSGTKYIHANHTLAKGLNFAAPDPSTGDASLSISLLTPAQSATYQCKVKKSPGVDTHKVTLLVMVKPSVPKCWVEGGELVGEAVSLHCKSEKGSTPLSYSWRRESIGPHPAPASQNSMTGELKISNHSQSSAGVYRCEVNNAVGSQLCMINLRANKPPNRFAVIVGTVVGSLLFIFILLVFIAIFYWKMSTRHRYEKEFSNEIREDAPPPESRSTSQHPQVAYCQVGRSEESSFNEGSTQAASSNSHELRSVKYDSKYEYVV